MQILVAADDEQSHAELSHTLRNEGYEVVFARDGRDALSFLSRQTCRLVIVDEELPGMTGLELCRTIRQCDFGSYIYTLLLTNPGGNHDGAAGPSAGADEYLPKPFHPAELAARLRAGRRVASLETRDLAIFALARMAESRDADTGHHLERVQCYSRALALQLAASPKYSAQIDEDFVRLIYLTSPLHDIGKVGIPDAVLLKPGRLSPEEFEVMKSHTLLGAATLDASLQQFPDTKFLTIARDIAATHHERWDGGGYPHKLAETDIPLCGRIVSLADVYDALSSRRVYKDAFTHSVTRSIIVDSSGSHFDPDIVEAFLAVEDVFREIRLCLAPDESHAVDRADADLDETPSALPPSCETTLLAAAGC